MAESAALVGALTGPALGTSHQNLRALRSREDTVGAARSIARRSLSAADAFLSSHLCADRSDGAQALVSWVVAVVAVVYAKKAAVGTTQSPPSPPKLRDTGLWQRLGRWAAQEP